MRYNKLNRPWGALLVAAVLSTGISQAIAAPPSNDMISGAIAIGALPFRSQLDTTEATSDTDDPIYGGHGSTVWYSFTPAADVRAVIDTIGSDYDTVLTVFTGAPGALRQVVGDDDGGGEDGQSRLLVEATGGVTYYIMVGGDADGSGRTLVLSAKVGPPPLVIGLILDPNASVDPQTGTVSVRGRVTCSQPAVVGVFGDMTQSSASAGGSVFTYVVCDGATEWSAEVSCPSHHFGSGTAHITATAMGYSKETGEYANNAASADVTLRNR